MFFFFLLQTIARNTLSLSHHALTIGRTLLKIKNRKKLEPFPLKEKRKSITKSCKVIIFLKQSTSTTGVFSSSLLFAKEGC